jgi:hypothetical protein
MNRLKEEKEKRKSKVGSRREAVRAVEFLPFHLF